MTDIKPEWAYRAREVLARISHMGGLHTYGEFYDEMAPRCDWPQPRTHGYWWVTNYVAPTLMELARLNKTFGEPMLSSLVRMVEGPIGEGFSGAVMERYGVIPEDLQAFAKVEAGKCYAYYGLPR